MSAISQDVSSAGMGAAIEANVVETFSLFGRAPGTELHDDDPALRFYVTPEVPFPLFNHVYLTRLSQEEGIDARIKEIEEQYAAYRVPLMWSVGPFSRPSDLGDRLESHGFAHVGDMPGMALDLQALSEDVDVPSPAELTIERVGDAEALRETVEVATAGLEMPEFTSEGFFELFTALGLTEDDPFYHYVGRVGGEAVAAATLSLMAGVAGIYNVATLPKARRQGLGAAMTRTALADARALGYRIGILQSSALGLGVYRRLGFEQYSTYSLYVGIGQG